VGKPIGIKVMLSYLSALALIGLLAPGMWYKALSFVTIISIILVYYRRKEGFYTALMLHTAATVHLLFQDSWFWQMQALIVASIILNAISIWYLLANRGYFSGKKSMHDRVYVRSLGAVSAVCVAGIFLAGAWFFLNNHGAIREISTKISSKTYTESLFYCEDSNDRDLCLLALAAKEKKGEWLCSRIESGFYRFTCQNAL